MGTVRSIEGALVHTADVAPEALAAYLRSWDEDVVPALRTLPGVADVRRYVATPALHRLRGPNPAPAFADGRSSHLVLVLFDGEDVAGLATQARAVIDRLAEAGATAEGLAEPGATAAGPGADQPEAGPGGASPPGGSVTRFQGVFRLVWALASEGVPTPAEGLPFLGHLGVQVAIGEVPDPARRPEVAAWYVGVHAPDVVDVPVVAGALGFASDPSDVEGRHLVVFLLQAPPATAVAAIKERVPQWRAAGRSPSPGGASKAIFNGPFALLSPLARYGGDLAVVEGEPGRLQGAP